MENSSRSVYLTTPLYYVNARPHLGHAYATILADTLKSYYFQRGNDVFMLTGSDEHGEKIAQVAAKTNMSPKAFVDQNAALFSEAWKAMGLNPDVFYRTTNPSHYALVQRALARLKDEGQITFSSYTGKYCVGCERFRTDQEWDEKGLCPDHQKPPEIREESNYFFKMSAFQERLKKHYQTHSDSIVPDHFRNEVLRMLDEPLEDLCISRPKTRLEWGIELPFDNKYVTYVWFDALLSYLGGIGYTGEKPSEEKNFKAQRWAGVRHLIGKDILKTHAIYWPTMLMGLGLEPFQQLYVSGYWLTAGLKMSKSLGNVVEPLDIKERFGMDSFRYFLLRDMSYGVDSSFTWEGFISRINSELANGLGNLASRTLTLVAKNLDATVPSKASRTPEDAAFLKEIHALPERFAKEFDSCRFHIALTAFAESVALCDKYINDQKPWALAKDPAQKARLEAVLGTAMDALASLSVVVASVLPEGSEKLRVCLGLGATSKKPAWTLATELLKEGSKLGEVPRLYPRFDMPKAEEEKKS